jgi:cytochrome P450
MEMKAMFSALLPRLANVELAGTPELTRSTFVSGLKRLPINYRMR